MLADAQIAQALTAMMQEIEAPTVPLAGIRRRIASQTHRRRSPQVLRIALSAAAAAIALAFVAFPSVTFGLVQTAEQRLAGILQWTPPPPPTDSLSSKISSHSADIASAQSRVSFKLVPPAGLPSDVTHERIWTTPVLVYSKVTHAWSKGDPEVTFVYDRTRSRSFVVITDRYDPRFGPPPRYMYENDSTGGRMLVKHRNFTWRNGDQETGVTESTDLSAAEIEAIRTAMRGTPIPPAQSRAELNSGTLVKQIYLLQPRPAPR
jgi:hypothetical protein